MTNSIKVGWETSQSDGRKTSGPGTGGPTPARGNGGKRWPIGTDVQGLYLSLLGRPGLVPVPRQIAGLARRVKGGMARGYSN